ncbi:phage tail protein [Candidatus Magnetaquicoccus inordinatus]|uniref:phage tail protein n=1 Tax=Candidatus Magnetaquicoccus inordinatus TaxID=2496818 RepID=UPI00102B0B03|nr:phage tail protein [Candidatus Magnetaquicoccus inordinatus]
MAVSAVVAVASYGAAEMAAAYVGAAMLAESGMLIGSVMAGEIGLATAVSIASFTGGVAGAIAGAAVSYGARSLLGGDSNQNPVSNSSASSILLNEQATVTCIPVVYGSRKVGGALIMPPTVTGAKKEYLHLVIVLCEGPIAAIDTVYIDGTNSNDAKFTGLVDIYKHLGTPNDPADPDLVANVPGWDSTCKLSGLAYLYVRVKYNSSVFRGLPVITAHVRGRTLYDPRTGQSAWSNNPVLAVRDLLTNQIYGKGLSTSSIDDVSFSAAASICETRIPAPTPQFSCNFSLGNLRFAIGTHTLQTGDTAVVTSSGSVPEPLDKITTYYVIKLANNTIGLAKSSADASAGRTIKLTSVGDGSISIIHSWTVLTTSGDNTVETEESVSYLATMIGDNIAFSSTESFPPFEHGDGVRVSSTGALPSPLVTDTTYYVIKIADEAIKLAATWANAMAVNAISLTNAGSGTLTITHYDYAKYACDGVIDTAQTVYNNVKAILTSCVGIWIQSGLKSKIVLDDVTEASAFVLSENNMVGSWQVTTNGKTGKFNRVTASIYNAANGWSADVATADSLEFRAVDGGAVLEKQISLPYTCSIYRATAIAWQVLNQSRYAVMAKVNAFPEALLCEVGDVITISHAMMGWTSKQFRVMAVVPNPNDEVSLSLAEYNAAVYAPGPMPSVNLVPSSSIPDPFLVAEPTNFSCFESLYSTSGSSGVKCEVEFTWTEAADAFVVRYQLEQKLSSETSFKPIGSTESLFYSWRDVQPGTYDFRVKAINQFGRNSEYTYINGVAIAGLTTPPTVMTGLSMSASGGMAVLRWDRSPDLDVRIGGKVMFRWSPFMTGASWMHSTAIGDAISGDQTVAVLPLKPGTYIGMIYDSSGNQAESVASVSTKQVSLFTFSSSNTIQFDPTFYGSGTGAVIESGQLRLDSTSNIDSWPDIDGIEYVDVGMEGGIVAGGSFDLQQEFDWGSVSKRRLTSSVAAEIVDPSNSGLVGNSNVIVYYSQTDDDPGGSPIWTPWHRLDSTEINARAVRFRVELLSDGIRDVIISSLSVTADQV